jgi:phenylacetate-coenzyme A ligase PaaK-like adenylate-forming protein
MPRTSFHLPLTDRWDQLSAAEQEELQDRLLRKMLTEQLIHSPFYRRRFRETGFDVRRFKGLEDLENIPFTTKKDLLSSDENPQAPKDFILQPDEESLGELPLFSRLSLGLEVLFSGKSSLKKRLSREYRPVTLTFTTGRSSAPTPLFYSLYDLELQARNGSRLIEVIGADVEKDAAVNLFPYAPHLAFWQTFMASFGSGLFMLNTGGGRVMGTEKIMTLTEKMKPTILMGIPGYFYHMLRKAEAEGYCFSSVNKVALGGEKVTPLLKGKIIEILERMGAENPRVFSILGFTESRQCWSECPSEKSSGFHIYPDMSLLEIIDPESGRILGEGETGELVYTTLVGRTSCLLRYRTGDIVQGGLTYGSCPHCGRHVPRLGTDIRRVSNQKDFNLSKVKGTLVDFNVLSLVLANTEGLEEWQIEIHKLNDDPLEVDQITLYLALEKNSRETEVKERVVKNLQAACEVSPNHVIVESLDSLIKRLGMEEKMKEERIVDRR